MITNVLSNTSKQVINSFLGEKSSTSMLNLIEYVKNNDLEDEAIVLLAKGLAASGTVIDDIDVPVCDIPSTGGPGSLSTLLCPVLLKLLGNNVLKMGVPGRPAGGIDVLAQIRGFQTNPTVAQLKSWLKENNYVHFLADQNFAPLDALFFHFRKENNGLDVPALVIASLLSKKVAVNLSHVGLDVRVSQFGNFGKSYAVAEENSKRFNRVASLLGIKSVCFLTNGSLPQQPYFGRGESILALNHLFANSKESLNRHFGQLVKMALSVSLNKSIAFKVDNVKDAFLENVITQGGEERSFYEIANRIEEEHTHEITASESGFFEIDLGMVRELIVGLQGRITDLPFPDPCGVILSKMPYEFINAGDVICTYRCIPAYLIEFKSKLEDCICISSNSSAITDLEVIN